MSASSLRRWLRRHPQPARLRVDGKDVAIATGPNQWSTTEESIRALGGNRIEALDSNGVCLRAMTLGSATVLPDEDDDDRPERSRFRESDLVTISRMILEASDAGARRHAEAYQVAFQRMTDLVSVLAARLVGLESAWQKAMNATARAQADAIIAQATGDETEHGADDAIKAMLVSMLMGGGMPQGFAPTAAPKKSPPNGATNGKKGTA